MSEIIISVINHLNQNTGFNYDYNNSENKKLIKNLLDKGFTENDLISVINKKVHDWKGTAYAIYIRPSTLFGTKFEKYLRNEKRTNNNTIEQLFNAVQQTKSANWKLDK
jgi:uncharacterized phage protein (TIGR02220 family)